MSALYSIAVRAMCLAWVSALIAGPAQAADAGAAALERSAGALPSFAPIYAIQGSGAASPMQGQTVMTKGVVTRVNNNGFFMQDPAGDGNPLTSDGLFVYTRHMPSVRAGQLVQLSGRVAEYNSGDPGNAQAAAHTVTEITGVGPITVLGSGYTVKPVPLVLPQAAADGLEAVEGMLVTVTVPLTVSQNYFLGRYGQITLSADGRLEHPTNLYRPGSVEARVLAERNVRARIVLDDGSSSRNPGTTPYLDPGDHTLRAGDTVANLTGVIDYGLVGADARGASGYKIHPTLLPAFTRANPRSAAPPNVGGQLKVASANVMNFFTTFADGHTAGAASGQGCSVGGQSAAAFCRGAANAAEFKRQRDKLIAELAALHADVLGLMEVQNNGATALQSLVDGLNAVLGAHTYAAVAEPAAGLGDDAIRVAMIYKPARLSRIGLPVADTDPVHKRASLAQTFATPQGERFTLVVSHFKSKSCEGADGADADQRDGQGCYNATRLREAQAVRRFVTGLQQAARDKRVLLVGDFNAYGQEDPIFEFTRNGYVDLVARQTALPYSFVFDGERGALDHALCTPELTAHVTRAAEWHINADEPALLDYKTAHKQPACAACGPDYYAPTPYRASDHDPLLIGLDLGPSEALALHALHR